MRNVWKRRQTGSLTNLVGSSRKKMQSASCRDIRHEAVYNREKLGKEHPISLAVISKMLELEQKLVQRTFSKDNFEQLLKLYSKCVEYYDSIKDPIKTYFMEKIQITVSNTKALDMLIEINELEKKQKNKDAEENGVKIDKSFVKKDTLDFIEEKLEKKQKEKIEERERRLSFNTKKKKRAQLTNLKFKVREHNKKVQVPKIVHTHFQSTKNNDEIINDNLSEQAKNFQERLERRRQLSFQRSLVSKSNLGNTNSYVMNGSNSQKSKEELKGKAILKSRSNNNIGGNILDGLNDKSINEDGNSPKNFFSASPQMKRPSHGHSQSVNLLHSNSDDNFLSPIISREKKNEKRFVIQLKVKNFNDDENEKSNSKPVSNGEKSSSLSSIEENDEHHKFDDDEEDPTNDENNLEVPTEAEITIERRLSKTEELLAQLSDEEVIVKGPQDEEKIGKIEEEEEENWEEPAAQKEDSDPKIQEGELEAKEHN